MKAEKGPLQHVVTNCRFDIEGDVAFGESYVRTVMTNADGAAQLGFGRYVDRFERRADEWRIAFRQVIIDIPRVGMDPGEFVAGHRDRRDPSYGRR
jgi:ketosteroid isomerase-like protein